MFCGGSGLREKRRFGRVLFPIPLLRGTAKKLKVSS